MSDFIAKVVAQLDSGSVESDLNKLCKDRNITLKATVDDSDLQNLARKISKDKSFQITAHIKDTSLKNIQNQLNNMTKGLSINLTGSNFNISGNGNGKQFQNYGRQVGNIVSQSAQKAVENVSSKVVGQGFTVSQGMSDKVESEMESIVKDMTNGKGKISKITIKTRTDFDKDTLQNIEELKSATVQYTNAAGDAVTKTFQLKQIGVKGNDEPLMGWAESVGSYTKSVQEASKVTTNFENTQKKTANRLSNQTKQIYQSAIDPNASKAIKEQSHLDDLQNRYNTINTEIGKLSGLTGSDFVDQQNHINDLITDLKIYKKAYQDAESTATALRSKPINVVQDEVSQKIKGLEADIKKAGVSSQELTDYVDQMNTALSSPLDASGINDVLNTYAKARAEMQKLKKEASSQQSLEKVQIKAGGLISELEKAKIDNSGLENFKTTINGIDVSVDDLITSLANVTTAGDISVITEQWKAFQTQAKQAGVMAEKSVDYARKISTITDNFNNGKYSADSKTMSAKLKPFSDKDIESVKNAKKYLQDYKDALSKLDDHFSGRNVLSNNDLVATFDKMNSAAEKFKNAMKEVSVDTKSFDSLDDKLQSVENRLASLKSQDTSKWTDSSGFDKLESNIKDAEDALTRFNAEKAKGQDADFSVLTSELKKVESATEKAEKQFDSLNKSVKEIDRLTESNKINTWLRNNDKVFKDNDLSGAISNIATRLKNESMSQGEFDSLLTQVRELQTRASSEGLTGKSWFSSFKQSFSAIAQFTGIYSILENVVDEVPEQMIQAVYDIDTAMTSLYKVTDETDARYEQFLSNANTNAQELGRTISSLVEQTAEWSKLGYTLDQAEELSKVSSIYANVGEVSDETAVSDLVTSMKAYGYSADDAMKIADSYNKLGNEFATSAADIGTGISNAASSLSTANNSFDQSVAMITGMAEITQEAGEAGNALKILSMRLRGYDEETEEYSNDVEILEGEIASLTKTASNPSGVSLFADEAKETFKSTYEIMEEIAAIYDELSDKNQAELLETIAGKNRGNQAAALIQAFQSGQVQKALDASVNSSGSALQEQERWSQSLEAKIQSFQAAFQNLSNDFISSDFLKGIIDAGTDVINFIDDLIERFGTLKTIIASLMLGKSIKSIA